MATKYKKKPTISSCIRDIYEILASNMGFFGIKLSNNVSKILREATLDVMTTEIVTKSAITLFVIMRCSKTVNINVKTYQFKFKTHCNDDVMISLH